MSTLTKALVICSAGAGITLIGWTLGAWIDHTIKKKRSVSTKNFQMTTSFNYDLAWKFGAVGMALIMPAVVYKLSLFRSKVPEFVSRVILRPTLDNIVGRPIYVSVPKQSQIANYYKPLY